MFLGLVVALQTIALFEYQRMALPQRDRFAEWTAAIFAAALLVALGLGGWSQAWVVTVSGLLVLFAVWLFRHEDLSSAANLCGLSLLGVLYLSLPLATLVALFSGPQGRLWVFFVLLTVMLTDTLALLVGQRFGRRPLYAAVSPNKSVEGALGGLAGGLIAGLIASLSFFSLPAWFVLPAALLLSCFGQLGDLFESMLKRSFRVKDSGTLIPGHGGLLDRLDSLLFAFPVAFGAQLLWQIMEFGP